MVYQSNQFGRLSRREFIGAVAAASLCRPFSLNAAENVPFVLGSGYRSAALSLGSRIISHSGIEKLSLNDAKVESQFGLVASQEDFESALSADASISGSAGAFSGKARASLSKQFERRHTSVCLAYTRRVTTGVARLAEFPVLSDAATQAADPSRFVRVYGDSLVTGVGVGGACCYLFRYDFASEKEATNFKASLSGTYGAASGSASVQMKQMASSAKAHISVRGYSTGTLEVPDLFGEQEMVGTAALFGGTVSSRMLGGLLKYYDSFPKHFHMGEHKSGYSQCEFEIKELSSIPSILPNQDAIDKLGGKCRTIADDLRKQRDNLVNLDAQLEYMSRVASYNVRSAVEAAPTARKAIASTIARVEGRLSDLTRETNVSDPFDFRSQTPIIPAHYCTADPSVTSVERAVPRGQWAYYNFGVNPVDYTKTVNIQASAMIYAVKHRPNGGRLNLVLYKTALPKPGEKPQVNSDGSPIGDIIESTTRMFSRGQVANLSVGPVTFVPGDDSCMYQVGVHSSGDYRMNGVVTLKTAISRQL